MREMGDEGEPDSVRLCSCHARDLEETALQSLVKRTGAASCRQVGTTRWELYYSRRPISAINAERRTLSLLMSCIGRERTRFPLVSAQGQPNLFLPMRLRHQIVGDTQNLCSSGDSEFYLLFSGDLLAWSRLPAILILSELLKVRLYFSPA